MTGRTTWHNTQLTTQYHTLRHVCPMLGQHYNWGKK